MQAPQNEYLVNQLLAFPEELRHILLSNNIAEEDFRLANISVIWSDLHSEMRLLADTGLRSKLHLEGRHLNYLSRVASRGFLASDSSGQRKRFVGRHPDQRANTMYAFSLILKEPRVTHVSDPGLDTVISLRLFNTLTIALD
jgi:hypothetical protein